MDAAVSQWFLDLSAANPWLVDVGTFLAYALHPWTFRLLVLLACGWAWASGRRRGAVLVAVTMAAGGLLGVGLKLAIRRPRPSWREPVAEEVGFSMPSGHALNATLGCLLLLVLLWPLLRRTGRTRVAVAAAGVVVTLACLDRLVLGVHYPSDVLAGVLVGAALAAVADRLVPRLRGGMAAGVREAQRPEESHG